MIKNFITNTKFFRLVRALSKKERLVFFGAIAVFFIALFTYGVLFVETNTYTGAAEGGEFREGIVGQPVFINPVIPVTDADRDLSRIVFSSVSDIAQSIKRSEDGKIWTVRLKENIFWHDGERVTTDDIIFTLEVIQDPESRSPLFASFQGVAAERLSELQIQFVLQNTYAFFESDHLSNLRIIPEHVFSDIPVQNMKLSSYGLSPVGSGPYKVISFEKNNDGLITNFEFEANKDYFEGRPNINKLSFKFYKDGKSAIRAYNLGQIDGFGLRTTEPLTENDVKIRNKSYYLESPRYYAAFINQSLAPEALQDIEVRDALTRAVDRRRIVNEVFLSQATPLYGPTALTPEHEAVDEYDFSLLQDVELNLTVPEEPFLVKTADILKENWEARGARVAVIVLPLKTIQDEVLRNSDYELLLFGNITKENQDLFSFWHSSRRFYPDQNLALYQNKNIDSLLESFRKTFEEEERSEMLKKISSTIAEDIPAIFLYSPRYVYIAVPRLGGFEESGIINTSDDRLDNIENWYVRTKKVLQNPEE